MFGIGSSDERRKQAPIDTRALEVSTEALATIRLHMDACDKREREHAAKMAEIHDDLIEYNKEISERQAKRHEENQAAMAKVVTRTGRLEIIYYLAVAFVMLVTAAESAWGQKVLKILLN